ncbi:hypothetical protein BHE74_00057898 [Ensete ventricosum]|nr:hypothetical protein BHE74_00057898 [Ensete ventricosum]
MLPLRFSNSGIRATVFMRKISFKLRVMRLNGIESFYVLLLRFYSERSEEGRPAVAISLVGVVGHGQAPCRGTTYGQAGCRGSRLRPRLPARRRLVDRKQSLTRVVARRRPPVGTVAHKDAARHLQGAAASKGGGVDRKGGRPLAGRLPTARAATAYAGAASTAVA